MQLAEEASSTPLSETDIDWLHLLLADWQVQADDVVDVDGRGRGGAAVVGGDESAVVCGQPQNQVGCRQVGEHLPVREEEVQPIDVLLRQRRRRSFFS